MTEVEYCACGEPLHYSHERLQQAVQDLIITYGPLVRVHAAGAVYAFPRHFVALHGASDTAATAARYNFERVG